MNYDNPLLFEIEESSDVISTESAEFIQSELPNQDDKNTLFVKTRKWGRFQFTNAEKPNIKQYVKY